MTKSAADIGTPTTTRRRRNSLIDVAATLPNLDASLDAFIAKVNSTDVDATNWSLPQATDATQSSIVEIEAAHAVELERLKHRMSLEAAANEKKLEANAKKLEAISAELAATQAELATRPVGGDPAAHAAIADVDFELSALRQESRSWQERARNAEKQANETNALVQQLQAQVAAKPVAATAAPALPANYADLQLANDRTRAALAAARAAAAGIAVSSTDLDRIESGLPKSATTAPKKSWLAIGGAFLGGAVLAFGANAAIGGGDKAQPAVVAPSVKPIAAPEVTPIAAPAPVQAAAAPVEAAPQPAVEAPAAVPAQEEAVAEVEIEAAAAPTPVQAAPKAVSKPKSVAKPAAKKPAAPAASKPAGSAKKAGGIVDPF